MKTRPYPPRPICIFLISGIFFLVVFHCRLSGQGLPDNLVNFKVHASANPDSICLGQSSNLNAEVLGGTPPFIFSWSPPDGLNHTNIPNPVATPDGTTWYFITVTDNLLNTTRDSVLLKVSTGPAVPGPISGQQVVCQGTTASYYVPVIPAATSYSWTIPPDDTILAGQNTPQITVKWDTASGNVSVIAGNGCGTSNPGVLAVDVMHSPAQPGSIIGPEMICMNNETVFYIHPVDEAQLYTWTVPENVQIVAGQGNDTVVVIWGSASGEISVIAENACNTSLPSSAMIQPGTVPQAAGLISGKDTLCQGTSGFIYSIPPVNGASTYSWSLPAGVSITGGIGTNAVILAFSSEASPGELTVSGKNECGNGPSSSLFLLIRDCTGLNDVSGLNDITAFPNPAKEKLTISFGETRKGLSLTLSDCKGRIVYHVSQGTVLQGTIKEIDLTGFSAGLYILQISDSSRVYRKKIMIE